MGRDVRLDSGPQARPGTTACACSERLWGQHWKVAGLSARHVSQVKAGGGLIVGLPEVLDQQHVARRLLVWKNVINIDSALHLAWLRRQFPDAPLDELFVKTFSYRYGETAIIQSGHGVESVKATDAAPKRVPEIARRTRLNRAA